MTRAKRISSLRQVICCAAISGIAFAVVGGAGKGAKADTASLPSRSIAYAFYSIDYGLYQTSDAKEECPSGLVEMGPREQFKVQFPDDGTRRTLLETQLAREADIWFPSEKPDQFPFREAAGKIAIGLDLDGKVKPSDFTSPDGKPGVDNQLFRVIGCIPQYRLGATMQLVEQQFIQKEEINRVVVEITGVDSLVNDDDVTVTTYHGLDPLLIDAGGKKLQPGGTQRIDTRWEQNYRHTAKGKIVNGVLITQPMDFVYSHETGFQDATYDFVRDARFELKLTPESADGVIGGYTDIETYYRGRNRQWGTHHQSYGQVALGSVYRELRKYADGFPDPETGKNTAISAAYTVKLIQVRILHPSTASLQGETSVAH